MRLMEIVNPEDQLELWRLISDKVWTALGQSSPRLSSSPTQFRAAAGGFKPAPGKVAVAPRKSANHAQPSATTKSKPVKGPTAPAPKELPKPTPWKSSISQRQPTKLQNHKNLSSDAGQGRSRLTPVPSAEATVQHSNSVVKPALRGTNSYSDRDMDDLIIHRWENPLKPLNAR